MRLKTDFSDELKNKINVHLKIKLRSYKLSLVFWDLKLKTSRFYQSVKKKNHLCVCKFWKQGISSLFKNGFVLLYDCGTCVAIFVLLFRTKWGWERLKNKV